MNPSIWKSIEIHCIASGFEYTQYVNLHKHIKCPGANLTEKGYKALERFFFIDMEENMKVFNYEDTPLEEINGR